MPALSLSTLCCLLRTVPAAPLAVVAATLGLRVEHADLPARAPAVVVGSVLLCSNDESGWRVVAALVMRRAGRPWVEAEGEELAREMAAAAERAVVGQAAG